jgi:DNA-binding transcriptional LysR family regulator
MADISETLRWAGVELRHLVALRTVVDEGSLAGAARRLGYSQPAVSQQLATLERLVGSRLVDRRAGAREVTLTEAGELVLLHGGAMLARAQAADTELRALAHGTVGTLRLGAFPSAGARIVPALLRRFESAWPDVAVQLIEDASEPRLLERIEAAELELAFATLPLQDGPFDAVEVLRDPYVLAVAADSPLAAAGRAPTLAQIAELSLIVCSQSHAPEAVLHAHGVGARVRYRIDDNQTIAGLVAAGLGAALVPRLALDPARNDVVQLELPTKLPPRLIALAWHRDRGQTQPARDLVELARQICAEF